MIIKKEYKMLSLYIINIMENNIENPVKESKSKKTSKEKVVKEKVAKEKVTKKISKTKKIPTVPTSVENSNANITTSFEENTTQNANSNFSINGLNKMDLKQQIIDSLFKHSPETIKLLTSMQENKNSFNAMTQETTNTKRINLSTQYIHRDKKYYYLDNNNNLKKDFYLSLQNNKVKGLTDFKVSMFLVKVVMDCNLPFLEFLVEMEETEKKLVFPSFTILNSDFDMKEEDDINKFDDPQSIFENICCKQFQEYTNSDSDQAKNAYKGYVELYDDKIGKNVIFPVFECTNIRFDLKQKQLWSVLDELLNEQHIYHYTIEKNIFMVFINNEFLSYIKNEKGEQVTFPCCLYLVKKTDDGEDYENVYLAEGVTDTVSIIDDKIEHTIFGIQHFFTTDPIDPEKEGRMKRYAAFVDNSLYFLNISLPLRSMNLEGDAEEADEDENVKTYKDYSSIYFFENFKQLWCISDVGRYTPL
jgi:hypothetical protein